MEDKIRQLELENQLLRLEISRLRSELATLKPSITPEIADITTRNAITIPKRIDLKAEYGDPSNSPFDYRLGCSPLQTPVPFNTPELPRISIN